ncbi:MAG: hypothetical protein ACLPKB_06735 [Xanthobacteraceae bacterium]
MQKYANRPVLVTVEALSGARRRYLENKGLTIIDLSPMIEGLRGEPMAETAETRAIWRFLEALEDNEDLTHAWPHVVPPPVGADPPDIMRRPPKGSNPNHEYPGLGNGTFDLWWATALQEMKAWETLDTSYPGWLALPVDNLDKEVSRRLCESSAIWVRSLSAFLGDQLRDYPRLRPLSGDPSYDGVRERLRATLSHVRRLVDIALRFRVSLSDEALSRLTNALVLVLLPDLSKWPTAAENNSDSLTAAECRVIEKSCRGIALGLGPKLAVEGRHDLLDQLVRALRADSLDPADLWRLEHMQALRALVTGDRPGVQRGIGPLASTADEVQSSETRGPTAGHSANDFGYAYAAALAQQSGMAGRAEALLQRALRELQAMPVPSDDAAPRGGQARNGGAARYDYHLRSREAWARFARLRWREETRRRHSDLLHCSEKDRVLERERLREYRSDLAFMEEQAAFRCNAAAEFARARASARAAMHASKESHAVRQFPALVDIVAMPIFEDLIGDLGDMAHYLRNAEPDYALALALRFLQGDDVKLAELAAATLHPARASRTRLVAIRFCNQVQELLWAISSEDRGEIERGVHAVETAAEILAGMLDYRLPEKLREHDAALIAALDVGGNGAEKAQRSSEKPLDPAQRGLLSGRLRTSVARHLAEKWGEADGKTLGHEVLRACLDALAEESIGLGMVELVGKLIRLAHALLRNHREASVLISRADEAPDGEMVYRLMTLRAPGAPPEEGRNEIGVRAKWRLHGDPVTGLDPKLVRDVLSRDGKSLQGLRQMLGFIATNGAQPAKDIAKARLAFLSHTRPKRAAPTRKGRGRK